MYADVAGSVPSISVRPKLPSQVNIAASSQSGQFPAWPSPPGTRPKPHCDFSNRTTSERRSGLRVHFRIGGVWVMPTSRPSGPNNRVTTWPQGSFRVATSNL